MIGKVSLRMYARLGERALPVGWAWVRLEPQIGNTVRLPTAPSGKDGWQSFRVVGKQLRFDGACAEVRELAEGTASGAIHLDVEPLD